MIGTPPPFGVSVERLDTHATVRVTGEVDMESSPTLRSRIVDLAHAGVRQITLDLADTAFIDSTGLHALVVAITELRVNGGDLVVRAPSKSASRLLQITGFDTLVHVV
jgi:anti-sigma B factor antagonist